MEAETRGGSAVETVEMNGRPCRVLGLLGKGKGGYSYLVEDGGACRVLKQLHHEPCAYYQFGDKLAAELRDYQILSALGLPLPRLLEVDRVGERILKEYIDGPTALDLVLGDQMTPDLIAQVEAMCDLLYPAGWNIDYFPTNFVLSGGKLWYIDYECNEYMEQWDFAHWGVRYWSKTPEFLQYMEERERQT